MNYRRISPLQAYAIQVVLVEECGYRVGECDQLRRAICTQSDDDTPKPRIVHEYRFCGLLGYGGKLYNDGNHANTPHVLCYPEDETPARIDMIDRANERIAKIFKGAP